MRSLIVLDFSKKTFRTLVAFIPNGIPLKFSFCRLMSNALVRESICSACTIDELKFNSCSFLGSYIANSLKVLLNVVRTGLPTKEKRLMCGLQ